MSPAEVSDIVVLLGIVLGSTGLGIFTYCLYRLHALSLTSSKILILILGCVAGFVLYGSGAVALLSQVSGFQGALVQVKSFLGVCSLLVPLPLTWLFVILLKIQDFRSESRNRS